MDWNAKNDAVNIASEVMNVNIQMDHVQMGVSLDGQETDVTKVYRMFKLFISQRDEFYACFIYINE